MLYRYLRGWDGLGLGDAKLFASSDAWLSLEGLPAVLLLACGAAIVGLLVVAWRQPAYRRAFPDLRHMVGLGLWRLVRRLPVVTMQCSGEAPSNEMACCPFRWRALSADQL